VLPYVLFAFFALHFMLGDLAQEQRRTLRHQHGPFWIARRFTADHYALRSTDTPFWSWFPNNVTLTGGGPGEPHPRQRVRGEQAQDVWKLDLERQ
jgi:hypothetical protein